jgi:hypothetical protein
MESKKKSHEIRVKNLEDYTQKYKDHPAALRNLD